ncbi:MAG: hypothetical protein DRH08_15015 [Deltaproteobacteria bacterium]|nr:MAG: hypothetical protein DRH08_15015 [Deltaproteobacteria bacterium]
MKYKLNLAATCKPSAEHNVASWAKILLLYSRYGLEQDLPENMLADCLGKHCPPVSRKSSTQAETNRDFIRYIAGLGWLVEVAK